MTLYKKPIATLRAGLPSVDLDDLGQRRAASLAVRAQRRHGAAGRRRHRRVDARARPRRRLPREVRRRFDGRAPRPRRGQPRPRPPLAARLSPPRRDFSAGLRGVAAGAFGAVERLVGAAEELGGVLLDRRACVVATPQLTVTTRPTFDAAVGTPRRSTRRRRCSATSSAPATSVAGRMTANSSPP